MLVRARNLTKLYGSVMGVNDIALDLKPGVHGLLGPNGAGKSTLLKLITGQLRPTEGSIEVFGEAPWRSHRLFKRIGFCPEQDALYPFLTALEYVAALARMSGLDRGAARKKATPSTACTFPRTWASSIWSVSSFAISLRNDLRAREDILVQIIFWSTPKGLGCSRKRLFEPMRSRSALANF